MAASNTAVLARLLSLRDPAQLLLVRDTHAQLAHFLIREFVHRNSHHIIYLSWETPFKPDFAHELVDCTQTLLEAITARVRAVQATRVLVIADSLNYIGTDVISAFVSSIVLLTTTMIGVLHGSVPQEHLRGQPSVLGLLTYVSSAIFDVLPLEVEDDEALEESLSALHIPASRTLNTAKFRLILTHRRKLGRAVTYKHVIDSETHTYEMQKETVEEIPDDEALLKDLTTFKLTTNTKQKLAREQVELPFMQAQESLGAAGGAIVYEFEKDDDYDEEDPYEDPF